MNVLIIHRRGVTVGVFVSENPMALRRAAEKIEGSALTWHNYVSHTGQVSPRDPEMSYAIHSDVEAVS